MKQIKNLEEKIAQQQILLGRKQQIIKESQKKQIFIQSLNKQAKQKTQNTLLDLYRLNEELYRHWYALKDIKTLLYRLNMYQKFHTIYKDLKYDQALFIN